MTSCVACRCQQHKPPDTHHCSVCRECVVEMDHHCPFLNNCVGRGNMRHFLLFLLWATLSMLYAVPICTLSILDQTDHILQVWATPTLWRCF